MNPESAKEVTKAKEITIPAEKDALVELFYSDPALRNLVKDAATIAENRVQREESERKRQREEAERLGNIQGWIDELGIPGLTVGQAQGLVPRSSWNYGIYHDGNYIGNVHSRPLSSITKEDVQLGIFKMKDKIN